MTKMAGQLIAAACVATSALGAKFVPETEHAPAAEVRPRRNLVRRATQGSTVQAMALVDNTEHRAHGEALEVAANGAVMNTNTSMIVDGSVELVNRAEVLAAAALVVDTSSEKRSEYTLKSSGKQTRFVSIAEDGNGLGLQCEEDYESGYSRPGTPKLGHVHVGMMKPEKDGDEADRLAVSFGDRLVKAATVTDAMRSCTSFFSFGDYTWCANALPKETLYAEKNPWNGKRCNVTGTASLMEKVNSKREANQGQYQGLSFGIEELDPWSELMSNMFFVNTKLFDCYITPPNGPMYNDWHGKHSKDSQCQDQRCYSIEYEINHVCVDQKVKERDGKHFKSLNDHLAGAEKLSRFVKMDVEGAEWGVLQDLLKSDEDISKIRTLDMEVHLTAMSNDFTMEEKVKIMEGLSEKFAVTGSSIQLQGEAETAEFNREVAKDPKFLRRFDNPHTSQGIPMAAYCISYVNRALL